MLIIFDRETSCILIFVFVKPVHRFFLLMELIFAHGTCYVMIFTHGTWCVLIFVRETCCTLIFHFVKFVHCFLLFVKLILFVELLSANFSCSWNLLRPVYLFMKLVVCWCFSSWNLCIHFSHHETDFVNGTYCVQIFLRGIYYTLIFSSWNLLHVDFSLLWKLWKMYTLIFPPRLTDFLRGSFCMLIVSCSWSLLCPSFLFVKLFASWFFSDRN